MNLAIVFSGQGGQHPGMLSWLRDDQLVLATCRSLKVNDWRQRLQDSEWATSNGNAQVLLTGLELAAWHQIADALPAPICIAGYSVGELAAFSAAGVFDAESALELARRRALAMDRCARLVPGGLLAVTGLWPKDIQCICSEAGLWIAIRNGPESVVLGGGVRAVERACEMAIAFGARATRLRVGIASHTPSMHEAAEEFAEVLSHVQFGRPRTALFSNAADRIQDATSAASALSAQIETMVHWDECMESIRSRSPGCVLEVGPGQALARMWNHRYPEIPARSCDDFRSAAAIARWVAACGPP